MNDEAGMIMGVLEDYGVCDRTGRQELWKVLSCKNKTKFEKYRDEHLASGKTADDSNNMSIERVVEELLEAGI